MAALQRCLAVCALTTALNPAARKLTARKAVVAPVTEVKPDDASVVKEACEVPPFNKVMAANSAEIAVRIMRAGTELNMATVGVYAMEDRNSAHRWCADQSFLLPARDTPVGAYLDPKSIVDIAEREGVEAVHPGYGFLSDRPSSRDCAASAVSRSWGRRSRTYSPSRTRSRRGRWPSRRTCPSCPARTMPWTRRRRRAFAEEFGLPVMIKALMGGGGKGMRIARTLDEVESQFESAASEALAAFGDGSCFLERYVEDPRHVEVQIVGDGNDVVHLWERDCSVQRRHQKVVEIAPAWNLNDGLRKRLQDDAVRLGKSAGYKNAGTVEFLVDVKSDEHFFIEVNPRIQVEHTVTEEVTGIDLVQTQFRIAAGASLRELGLIQQDIKPRGVAIQCRITTENPERDFAPDAGTLAVYRHAQGVGMRVDGVGYTGMRITPYFDSLLVKYTAARRAGPPPCVGCGEHC